jgi:FkbM family methyltransferase
MSGTATAFPTNHNWLKTAYWRILQRFRRLALHLDYLKLRCIQVFGRRGEGVVKIAGRTVYYGDLEQLVKLFGEIYIRRCYYFQLSDKPTVIDGGANIGLATLFFKSQYPNASVAAFEPNPQAFAYLKKNVECNGLTGVTIHNVALGEHDGSIAIYRSSDMVSGDIGVSAIKQHVEYFHGGCATSEITVPCKRLSPYVADKVDLLKLDVEGSEAKIIAELGDQLIRVENIVMEYHYHYTYPDNPLSSIISAMERCDHLYHLSGGQGVALSKERTYLLRSTRLANNEN